MNVKQLMASFLVACSAAEANAVSLNFACISNKNVNNCATGVAQFTVEALQGATTNQANFTFRNSGPNAAVIEAVYFDNGSLLGISSLIDADQGVGGHPGVDFTGGSASPGNLPAGNTLTPHFDVTAGFLADSDTPNPVAKGIGPGEWLTVIFNLQNNQSFDVLLSELATGEVRIGLHAQSFGNGGSESFVNTPVPAAFLLLGTGLLSLLGFRRRRA
jgi:hypothetical protein